MKKLIKILPIIMTVMMVFMAVSPVFGLGVTITQPTDQKITSLGGQILGVIQIIGNILAVGVLMVLGIKYMMGSAQEKAEYKKTFIPYIVGAILLFAAVNIANAVFSMVQNLGQGS